MKQIIGSNMGAKLSTQVSDTKMCQITNHIMSKFKFPNQIIYNEWIRDDGLIAFNETKNDIL